MSTTDKPTWQLAEQICEVPAVDEAIRTFLEDNTGDNAIGLVLAVLEHQAATEAAKATGTAGELPPLPDPLEINWPELNSNALGCGVEDRGIRDSYDAAEYGWQNGVDKAIERVPEAIYDADQMREYGQQCAEAARQPAPVLAVKTWRERWQEIFKMLPPVYSVDACMFMRNEIEDLRAALAATAAPVLSDAEAKTILWLADDMVKHRLYKSHIAELLRSVVTATRSQP